MADVSTKLKKKLCSNYLKKRLINTNVKIKLIIKVSKNIHFPTMFFKISQVDETIKNKNNKRPKSENRYQRPVKNITLAEYPKEFLNLKHAEESTPKLLYEPEGFFYAHFKVGATKTQSSIFKFKEDIKENTNKSVSNLPESSTTFYSAANASNLQIQSKSNESPCSILKKTHRPLKKKDNQIVEENQLIKSSLSSYIVGNAKEKRPRASKISFAAQAEYMSSVENFGSSKSNQTEDISKKEAAIGTCNQTEASIGTTYDIFNCEKDLGIYFNGNCKRCKRLEQIFNSKEPKIILPKSSVKYLEVIADYDNTDEVKEQDDKKKVSRLQEVGLSDKKVASFHNMFGYSKIQNKESLITNNCGSPCACFSTEEDQPQKEEPTHTSCVKSIKDIPHYIDKNSKIKICKTNEDITDKLIICSKKKNHICTQTKLDSQPTLYTIGTTIGKQLKNLAMTTKTKICNTLGEYQTYDDSPCRRGTIDSSDESLDNLETSTHSNGDQPRISTSSKASSRRPTVTSSKSTSMRSTVVSNRTEIETTNSDESPPRYSTYMELTLSKESLPRTSISSKSPNRRPTVASRKSEMEIRPSSENIPRYSTSNKSGSRRTTNGITRSETEYTPSYETVGGISNSNKPGSRRTTAVSNKSGRGTVDLDDNPPRYSTSNKSGIRRTTIGSRRSETENTPSNETLRRRSASNNSGSRRTTIEAKMGITRSRESLPRTSTSSKSPSRRPTVGSKKSGREITNSNENLSRYSTSNKSECKRTTVGSNRSEMEYAPSNETVRRISTSNKLASRRTTIHSTESETEITVSNESPCKQLMESSTKSETGPAFSNETSQRYSTSNKSGSRRTTIGTTRRGTENTPSNQSLRRKSTSYKSPSRRTTIEAKRSDMGMSFSRESLPRNLVSSKSSSRRPTVGSRKSEMEIRPSSENLPRYSTSNKSGSRRTTIGSTRTEIENTPSNETLRRKSTSNKSGSRRPTYVSQQPERETTNSDDNLPRRSTASKSPSRRTTIEAKKSDMGITLSRESLPRRSVSNKSGSKRTTIEAKSSNTGITLSRESLPRYSSSNKSGSRRTTVGSTRTEPENKPSNESMRRKSASNKLASRRTTIRSTDPEIEITVSNKNIPRPSTTSRRTTFCSSGTSVSKSEIGSTDSDETQPQNSTYPRPTYCISETGTAPICSTSNKSASRRTTIYSNKTEIEITPSILELSLRRKSTSYKSPSRRTTVCASGGSVACKSEETETTLSNETPQNNSHELDVDYILNKLEKSSQIDSDSVSRKSFGMRTEEISNESEKINFDNTSIQTDQIEKRDTIIGNDEDIPFTKSTSDARQCKKRRREAQDHCYDTCLFNCAKEYILSKLENLRTPPNQSDDQYIRVTKDASLSHVCFVSSSKKSCAEKTQSKKSITIEDKICSESNVNPVKMIGTKKETTRNEDGRDDESHNSNFNTPTSGIDSNSIYLSPELSPTISNTNLKIPEGKKESAILSRSRGGIEQYTANQRICVTPGDRSRSKSGPVCICVNKSEDKILHNANKVNVVTCPNNCCCDEKQEETYHMEQVYVQQTPVERVPCPEKNTTYQCSASRCTIECPPSPVKLVVCNNREQLKKQKKKSKCCGFLRYCKSSKKKDKNRTTTIKQTENTIKKTEYSPSQTNNKTKRLINCKSKCSVDIRESQNCNAVPYSYQENKKQTKTELNREGSINSVTEKTKIKKVQKVPETNLRQDILQQEYYSTLQSQQNTARRPRQERTICYKPEQQNIRQKNPQRGYRDPIFGETPPREASAQENICCCDDLDLDLSCRSSNIKIQQKGVQEALFIHPAEFQTQSTPTRTDCACGASWATFIKANKPYCKRQENNYTYRNPRETRKGKDIHVLSKSNISYVKCPASKEILRKKSQKMNATVHKDQSLCLCPSLVCSFIGKQEKISKCCKKDSSQTCCKRKSRNQDYLTLSNSTITSIVTKCSSREKKKCCRKNKSIQKDIHITQDCICPRQDTEVCSSRSCLQSRRVQKVCYQETGPINQKECRPCPQKVQKVCYPEPGPMIEKECRPCPSKKLVTIASCTKSYATILPQVNYICNNRKSQSKFTENNQYYDDINIFYPMERQYNHYLFEPIGNKEDCPSQNPSNECTNNSKSRNRAKQECPAPHPSDECLNNPKSRNRPKQDCPAPYPSDECPINSKSRNRPKQECLAPYPSDECPNNTKSRSRPCSSTQECPAENPSNECPNNPKYRSTSNNSRHSNKRVNIRSKNSQGSFFTPRTSQEFDTKEIQIETTRRIDSPTQFEVQKENKKFIKTNSKEISTLPYEKYIDPKSYHLSKRITPERGVGTEEYPRKMKVSRSSQKRNYEKNVLSQTSFFDEIIENIISRRPKEACTSTSKGVFEDKKEKCHKDCPNSGRCEEQRRRISNQENYPTEEKDYNNQKAKKKQTSVKRYQRQVQEKQFDSSDSLTTEIFVDCPEPIKKNNWTKEFVKTIKDKKTSNIYDPDSLVSEESFRQTDTKRKKSQPRSEDIEEDCPNPKKCSRIIYRTSPDSSKEIRPKKNHDDDSFTSEESVQICNKHRSRSYTRRMKRASVLGMVINNPKKLKKPKSESSSPQRLRSGYSNDIGSIQTLSDKTDSNISVFSNSISLSPGCPNMVSSDNSIENSCPFAYVSKHRSRHCKVRSKHILRLHSGAHKTVKRTNPCCEENFNQGKLVAHHPNYCRNPQKCNRPAPIKQKSSQSSIKTNGTNKSSESTKDQSFSQKFSITSRSSRLSRNFIPNDPLAKNRGQVRSYSKDQKLSGKRSKSSLTDKIKAILKNQSKFKSKIITAREKNDIKCPHCRKKWIEELETPITGRAASGGNEETKNQLEKKSSHTSTQCGVVVTSSLENLIKEFKKQGQEKTSIMEDEDLGSLFSRQYNQPEDVSFIKGHDLNIKEKAKKKKSNTKVSATNDPRQNNVDLCFHQQDQHIPMKRIYQLSYQDPNQIKLVPCQKECRPCAEGENTTNKKEKFLEKPIVLFHRSKSKKKPSSSNKVSYPIGDRQPHTSVQSRSSTKPQKSRPSTRQKESPIRKSTQRGVRSNTDKKSLQEKATLISIKSDQGGISTEDNQSTTEGFPNLESQTFPERVSTISRSSRIPPEQERRQTIQIPPEKERRQTTQMPPEKERQPKEIQSRPETRGRRPTKNSITCNCSKEDSQPQKEVSSHSERLSKGGGTTPERGTTERHPTKSMEVTSNRSKKVCPSVKSIFKSRKQSNACTPCPAIQLVQNNTHVTDDYNLKEASTRSNKDRTLSTKDHPAVRSSSKSKRQLNACTWDTCPATQLVPDNTSVSNSSDLKESSTLSKERQSLQEKKIAPDKRRNHQTTTKQTHDTSLNDQPPKVQDRPSTQRNRERQSQIRPLTKSKTSSGQRSSSKERGNQKECPNSDCKNKKRDFDACICRRTYSGKNILDALRPTFPELYRTKEQRRPSSAKSNKKISHTREDNGTNKRPSTGQPQQEKTGTGIRHDPKEHNGEEKKAKRKKIPVVEEACVQKKITVLKKSLSKKIADTNENDKEKEKSKSKKPSTIGRISYADDVKFPLSSQSSETVRRLTIEEKQSSNYYQQVSKMRKIEVSHSSLRRASKENRNDSFGSPENGEHIRCPKRHNTKREQDIASFIELVNSIHDLKESKDNHNKIRNTRNRSVPKYGDDVSYSSNKSGTSNKSGRTKKGYSDDEYNYKKHNTSRLVKEDVLKNIESKHYMGRNTSGETFPDFLKQPEDALFYNKKKDGEDSARASRTNFPSDDAVSIQGEETPTSTPESGLRTSTGFPLKSIYEKVSLKLPSFLEDDNSTKVLSSSLSEHSFVLTKTSKKSMDNNNNTKFAACPGIPCTNYREFMESIDSYLYNKIQKRKSEEYQKIDEELALFSNRPTTAKSQRSTTPHYDTCLNYPTGSRILRCDPKEPYCRVPGKTKIKCPGPRNFREINRYLSKVSTELANRKLQMSTTSQLQPCYSRSRSRFQVSGTSHMRPCCSISRNSIRMRGTCPQQPYCSSRNRVSMIGTSRSRNKLTAGGSCTHSRRRRRSNSIVIEPKKTLSSIQKSKQNLKKCSTKNLKDNTCSPWNTSQFIWCASVAHDKLRKRSCNKISKRNICTSMSKKGSLALPKKKSKKFEMIGKNYPSSKLASSCVSPMFLSCQEPSFCRLSCSVPSFLDDSICGVPSPCKLDISCKKPSSCSSCICRSSSICKSLPCKVVNSSCQTPPCYKVPSCIIKTPRSYSSVKIPSVHICKKVSSSRRSGLCRVPSVCKDAVCTLSKASVCPEPSLCKTLSTCASRSLFSTTDSLCTKVSFCRPLPSWKAEVSTGFCENDVRPCSGPPLCPIGKKCSCYSVKACFKKCSTKKSSRLSYYADQVLVKCCGNLCCSGKSQRTNFVYPKWTDPEPGPGLLKYQDRLGSMVCPSLAFDNITNYLEKLQDLVRRKRYEIEHLKSKLNRCHHSKVCEFTPRFFSPKTYPAKYNSYRNRINIKERSSFNNYEVGTITCPKIRPCHQRLSFVDDPPYCNIKNFYSQVRYKYMKPLKPSYNFSLDLPSKTK